MDMADGLFARPPGDIGLMQGPYTGDGRNPYAPEPLSFSNFPLETAQPGDEPGTFSFKDLQNIQDFPGSTPTLKADAAGTSHMAYENALLEYSGLNEETCDNFQFNLSTGSSPMKLRHHSEQYTNQLGKTAPAPNDNSMQPNIPVTGQRVMGTSASEHTMNLVYSDDDREENPAVSSMPAMPMQSRVAGRSAGGSRPRVQRSSAPVGPKHSFNREQSIQLLNKAGGVATEDELNQINPEFLSPEEVKKLKRMRRAIRNRESATASRMRRKEYIESLEKRTSELCSENAMLDLSVTKMKMREKGKAEALERVREENSKLRAESYANRAENHQLRQDKQMIEERLKNVQLVDDVEKDIAFSGPGTWPAPKSRPQRVIMEPTARS